MYLKPFVYKHREEYTMQEAQCTQVLNICPGKTIIKADKRTNKDLLKTDNFQ